MVCLCSFFLLAIPSLHLLPGSEKPGVSKRVQRMAQKEKKQIVEALMTKENELPVLEDNVLFETPSTSKESETDVLKRKIEALQQENILLKQKLKEHENETNDLKNHIFLLNQEIKKDKIEFEEKAKLAFKNFLTANQVEIALKKKCRARWTQEELSRAFTLRYFSKRAYVYLRNTLHYPLPGITTLT